jgi:hypothetical protein
MMERREFLLAAVAAGATAPAIQALERIPLIQQVDMVPRREVLSLLNATERSKPLLYAQIPIMDHHFAVSGIAITAHGMRFMEAGMAQPWAYQHRFADAGSLIIAPGDMLQIGIIPGRRR